MGTTMHTIWKWVGGAAAACFALTAHANTGIEIQVPAVLDHDAPITESVRHECNVEQLVGNSVFEKASELNIGAKKARWAEHTDQTPFLRLTLLTVKGVVGSRIRGGEQIAMRAEILMSKRIPVSKEFVRSSSVSSFSFVGTCSIMETIADELGQDVVQWLPGAIAAIPANMPNAPWATRTAGIDHNAAAKNAARRHNWHVHRPR